MRNRAGSGRYSPELPRRHWRPQPLPLHHARVRLSRHCLSWVHAQNAPGRLHPGCKNPRFATRPSSPRTHLTHPLTALARRWELQVKWRDARNASAELSTPNPGSPIEKLHWNSGAQCHSKAKAREAGKTLRQPAPEELESPASCGELQRGAGSPNATNHPGAGAQLHCTATAVCCRSLTQPLTQPQPCQNPPS